jgi:hypothetical protein
MMDMTLEATRVITIGTFTVSFFAFWVGAILAGLVVTALSSTKRAELEAKLSAKDAQIDELKRHVSSAYYIQNDAGDIVSLKPAQEKLKEKRRAKSKHNRS